MTRWRQGGSPYALAGGKVAHRFAGLRKDGLGDGKPHPSAEIHRSHAQGITLHEQEGSPDAALSGHAEEAADEWRKGRARLNRTVAALIDRGVDHKLAQALCKDGWSLAKLRQEKLTVLRTLGLSDEMARAILSGKRPPIPFNNLANVLIANRFSCCVCRDTKRSVVVHHIKDWAESRDHSCNNLAILCLDDHDKAHKRGGHTQNLTPDLIRRSKRQWEDKVAKMDTRAILDASAVESDSWWLFNHIRLFGLAADLNIALFKVDGFTDARRRGLIDSAGLLLARDPRTSWMYEGADGIPLQRYVAAVLRAVLEHLTVYNVSDDLDRSTLAGVIHPGQFIFLQGTIYFQTRGVANRGPGQAIIGTRRVNGVEISFTADRWEATANSVWGNWLKGRRDIGCLLRVITAGRSDAGAFHVGTTAIAIGAALHGLKTREYANAPYRRGYELVAEDDLGRDEDEFSAL